MTVKVEEKRAGLIELDLSFLSVLMKLPSDHKITKAKIEDESLILQIEGPQMPVVHNGMLLECIDYYWPSRGTVGRFES